MTLAPLLNATPIIRFHAAFAFVAIGLGAVQLLAPRARSRTGRSAGRGPFS
ncbi:MAG TPA: hypothetical protein VGL12_08825 [Roseiarcus sp.]